MLPFQKFFYCAKKVERFNRTFCRAAMDLGENVEVSVNIEERVERRALIYIFNNLLFFKRKVRNFFDFCRSCFP